MEKTKVLYLVTKGNWGGAQKYTYDFATSLSKEQYDISVAFGEPGIFQTELDKKNVRSTVIPELGRDVSIGKDLGSFYALYKLFKKERPDIIHLNSSKIGGLGALAGRLGCVPKIIFTAHGWAFLEDHSTISKTAIKFLSWLTVILCHTTITLHERDLHTFDLWPFTKGKLVKIYNGIKNSTGLEKNEARQTLKEKYGVEIGGRLIGTIAELHKNKGLPYLIEAMRKLPETVSLCIIGEGEERKNLESLIRREHLDKRVHLSGFIPDAQKLLPAFDIFVLPSIKEGLPFVLLEAGNANVPIISTSVGGIPEIIEDKKEGLLVPTKNPTALREAVEALLKNPETGKTYASAFAKRIQEKFNFETATFPETLKIYKKAQP